jgi:hypothetical protein
VKYEERGLIEVRFLFEFIVERKPKEALFNQVEECAVARYVLLVGKRELSLETMSRDLNEIFLAFFFESKITHSILRPFLMVHPSEKH